MASIPTFQTERLILRGLTREDIPSYQKHFVNYEVIRHLSYKVPWPYPAGGVQTYFESILMPRQGIDRWSWGIRLKNAPSEVIGCIDLWRQGDPENRGFWLSQQHWGKGIMTEALVPITDYAFDELDFDVLHFASAVGNEKSRRIKEKTGARFVSVQAAKFVDPNYSAHENWELRKEDWLRFRESAISA